MHFVSILEQNTYLWLYQKTYNLLLDCPSTSEMTIVSYELNLLLHINTLRPRRNGHHFADDLFKYIFLNENAWILIEISLKFVPICQINNTPALVQIMAWHQLGDKLLSESVMARLPTPICITRPQWVSTINGKTWNVYFTGYPVFFSCKMISYSFWYGIEFKYSPQSHATIDYMCLKFPLHIACDFVVNHVDISIWILHENDRDLAGFDIMLISSIPKFPSPFHTQTQA